MYVWFGFDSGTEYLSGSVSQSRTVQVQEDLKQLQNKFKENYEKTQAYHMANMRDIPPIAGVIAWAKQIERKVISDMRRIEEVLGTEWDKSNDGKKLRDELEKFAGKLEKVKRQALPFVSMGTE